MYIKLLLSCSHYYYIKLKFHTRFDFNPAKLDKFSEYFLTSIRGHLLPGLGQYIFTKTALFNGVFNAAEIGLNRS